MMNRTWFYEDYDCGGGLKELMFETLEVPGGRDFFGYYFLRQGPVEILVSCKKAARPS